MERISRNFNDRLSPQMNINRRYRDIIPCPTRVRVPFFIHFKKVAPGPRYLSLRHRLKVGRLCLRFFSLNLIIIQVTPHMWNKCNHPTAELALESMDPYKLVHTAFFSLIKSEFAPPSTTPPRCSSFTSITFHRFDRHLLLYKYACPPPLGFVTLSS